jgi:general secretion pathway protein N
LGRISLVVDGGGDAPSHLLISPWRNEVEVLRGNALLPAQLLAVFAPQLTPYRLSGELLLTSDHFLLTPDSSAGTVTLDWRQATSGLTDIAPLGDYRVLLLGEGKDLKVTLSTLGGKLLLSGNGLIQPGGTLSLQGTAQAVPDQRESLSDLLHHIGPELSPGVFGFSLLAQ